MPLEKRVEAFDLTDPDGRASYEDLVNKPATHVQAEQTTPMADGSIVRVVDYAAPSEVLVERPIYTPPIA